MNDYKALIKEAREYVDALVGGESANWVHLVQHADFLADAVEALLAENECYSDQESRIETILASLHKATEERDALRDSFQEAESIANRLLSKVIAERDALRTQLDNMTMERRTKQAGIYGFRAHIYEQRLVGPWVEVSE